MRSEAECNRAIEFIQRQHAPPSYTIRLYQDRRDALLCALNFFEKWSKDDHDIPVAYVSAIGLLRKELEIIEPDMKF